jgi:hypothetical protein
MKHRLPERVLNALLILSLSAAGLPAKAQERNRPAGALTATGEVFVNDAPVSGDGTVFEGDTLRTGANGAASVVVAGRGMLILGAGTTVQFLKPTVTAPQFASFEIGSLGLRGQQGARDFQIKVGDYAVFPVSSAEAAAEITRGADGSARIEGKRGSVGVIRIEGQQAVFVRQGQAVNITERGALLRVEDVGAAPATQPGTSQPQPAQTQEPAGKGRGVYIGIGLAAAGGVAAAVFLLAGKDSSRPPVSPSTP